MIYLVDIYYNLFLDKLLSLILLSNINLFLYNKNISILKGVNMFFKLFGPPDNDPNGAGYPSTTGNPSGGGRGNDDPD